MNDDERGRFLAGKYELVEPVGRGGMASVWLGLTHGEAGFTRPVAIKRVLRHLHKDANFEHMFVEEARVVADLHHPNIVQVHDFGRDERGGYFIVMEWVKGLNMESYVRSFGLVREAPPWQLVCAIAIEGLRALAAAHERTDPFGNLSPVIHRDVAPANILIGSNGNVKLADFGLSRATDRPSTTDPGVVKGKVSYMPPECFEGHAPDLSTDLYSMGVVLWEALACRPLFGGTGTDVEVAMRVINEPVPVLSEIRRDLPSDLVDLVAMATARRPEHRFGRAMAMVEALSNILRCQEFATDGPAIARSVDEALGRLAQARSLPVPSRP